MKAEIKELLFKAKEVKDTLRLSGNIYKSRTKETAYSRGFVRSEKYINEIIETLESLSKAPEKEEENIFNAGFDEGYTSPLELDEKRVTEDEYKNHRKSCYKEYISSNQS